MSLLSKLFGGGGAAREVEPVEYDGFKITPNPAKEGSKYRIGAVIEKEIDGALKSHTLVRADTLDDQNAAVEASTRKAKQVIDEQGDRIFR